MPDPLRSNLETVSGRVGMFSGSPGSWMVTIYLWNQVTKGYDPFQVDAWTDETARVLYNGECVTDAKDLLGRLVNATGMVTADLSRKQNTYRGWFGKFVEIPYPPAV